MSLRQALVAAVFMMLPAVAGAAGLNLTPNPAHPGDQVWPSGCGYVVGKQVVIVIYGPDAIVSYNVGVDPSGCLYPSNFWTTSAGDYSVDAKQTVKGKRQSVMGSAMLEVY